MLGDAELAGYAESAGTAGEPWPSLEQIYWVRRERAAKGLTKGKPGTGSGTSPSMRTAAKVGVGRLARCAGLRNLGIAL